MLLVACQLVVEEGVESTFSVQRTFRIGSNGAARCIEQMEPQGIISTGRVSNSVNGRNAGSEYDR